MAALDGGRVGSRSWFFPFTGEQPEEPYVVLNYVGEEHEAAMTAELANEMKDEFASVKNAYSLLRPKMHMVKMDLEEAYISLPMASQYCATQCFQWRGVRYMDTRRPFSNRGLPGILMQYTWAIVAWTQAQGVPCVGYLDDFFIVLHDVAEAQEHMHALLLSTEGECHTASIDEERVQQATSKLREVRSEAAAGPLRRGKLESLPGLLAFCSQVAWGLSLYARQGFTLVTAMEGRGRVTVGRGIMQDIKCALTQVDKFWGPVEYIPLLRKNFYLCAKHGIQFRPNYVTSEDNRLTDLLSRLKLEEFHMRWALRRQEVLWRQDRDDWQFSPVLFAEMDEEFGPFTRDACVAASRGNAFCVRSWSAVEDARKQRFDGLNAWANLPFSVMYDILVYFLRCKQMGTGGCFLVLVWKGDEAYELVSEMREVFRPAQELLEELAAAVEGYQDMQCTETTHRGCAGHGTGRPKPMMPITLRDLSAGHGEAVGKAQAWHARAALVREDVLCAEAGDVVWIRVRHSKTVQCVKRYHWVSHLPLAAVPGSRPCPVKALRRLMLVTGDLPEEAPLFQMEGKGKRGRAGADDACGAGGGPERASQAGGAGPARFAGHSLRRGRATAALRLRVDRLCMKLPGNWKPDCWERYCELDDEQRLILPAALSEAAKAKALS
ncbi:hypothetical protein CYMTET_14894 [Cymbomonas tetramitiformis]|uniref:SpoVT-AbrB domain-containing protein n=1 Tax=Cymbomonas tetramitiformis TaxID=36881 RepID=A0AAE0GFG1_9CHLO|nr:hypothetical protein CYMTET_14894 [Cymbomonas tetramitiformis]